VYKNIEQLRVYEIAELNLASKFTVITQIEYHGKLHRLE